VIKPIKIRDLVAALNGDTEQAKLIAGAMDRPGFDAWMDGELVVRYQDGPHVMLGTPTVIAWPGKDASEGVWSYLEKEEKI